MNKMILDEDFVLDPFELMVEQLIRQMYVDIMMEIAIENVNKKCQVSYTRISSPT